MLCINIEKCVAKHQPVENPEVLERVTGTHKPLVVPEELPGSEGIRSSCEGSDKSFILFLCTFVYIIY